MTFVDSAAADEFFNNLDDSDGEPPATPETPPAEPAAETPAPETAAPAVPEDGDTFPRTYVEELRQESAKYRTRAQPFLDAFEGYDDDARAAMLDIARNLVNAPEAAARDMVEVARALMGDKFDSLLSDEPKPLTREDLEREFEARESARRQDELVAQVEREVADLGYEPDSDEASMLYSIAARRGGDIQGAHKFLQDLRQVAVDEYIAGKRQQNESYPAVTADSVPPSGEVEAPKNFDEARDRLRSLLG